MEEFLNLIQTTETKFFEPSDNDVKIRVKYNTPAIWAWCKRNIQNSKWKCMIPITGHSATYVFNNSEDAIIFNLRYSND